MKKILNVFFLLLVLQACQIRKQGSSEPVKVLDIQSAFTNGKEIPLSKIADSIAYIQLETSDSCLIGSIGKLLLFDRKLFIHDVQTQRIMVFDYHGKFLRSLGSKGKGPGEFLQVSDFTIAAYDSTVCVLDDLQRKFLKFRMDGKCIVDKTLPTNPDKLSFLDESLIVQYNCPDFLLNQQCSFAIFDQNIQVTHKLLDHTNEKINPAILNLFSHSRSFFSYVNDTLAFWECRYDTIYRITRQREIKRKYYLQYDDKPTPTGGFDYTKMSDMNEIDWLRETDQYIFIRSKYKDKYLAIVYFKKSDEGICLNNNTFSNDMDGGIQFFPQGIACAEKLYLPFSMFELKTKWEKNKKPVSDELRRLLEHTQYIDNPCIMLISLK